MQPATDLIQASQFLSAVDADWAALIASVGPCVLTVDHAREPYEALMRSVAYQQLHAKAGDAIIARLLALFDGDFPTPTQLMTTSVEALRTCGFSANKVTALYAVAHGAQSALVPTRLSATQMTDDALITQLTQLKGIGRWTVEMLLIFTLGRMDVLPVQDLGIAKGYQRLKKLDSAPTPTALTALSLAWRPYRTVASWYLWRVPKNCKKLTSRMINRNLDDDRGILKI